jgi:large subunit ribosomal protein L2
MALRKYKPTVRRAAASCRSPVRGGSTKQKPEKSSRRRSRRRAAGTTRAGSPRATRAAATSAAIRAIDFKRQQGRRAGQGRRDRVRPEPLAPASPCCTTPTARRATSSRPRGCGSARRSSPGPRGDIRPGNALPLENIPTGTLVHNVELKPGKGGQMARSAGLGRPARRKDDGYGVLRLPSGEMRRVPLTCARRSDRSATSTTRRHRRQGRPARAGRASARPCAVPR